MPELIKNFMDRIQIGAEQSYKNLAVFPVVSDYVIPFDYLTLDEALTKGLMEIVEIDKGGSVPDLKVINKSEKNGFDPGRRGTGRGQIKPYR